MPHRVGSLATVASAIAEIGGVIGEVATVSVSRRESIREITVEVADKAGAEQLAVLLGGLEGVHVIWFHDRAFIAHDGGKLEVHATREVRTNQDVRDVYTPGVARVCTAIAEHPELAP